MHHSAELIQPFSSSPEKQQQLYKRTLIIVVLAQLFGGAGLAAGVTVGALLAKDMLGTDSYGGVPVALLTLGSAAGAYLIGQLSQRNGRRIGLAAGFLCGGVGAAGIVGAAVMDSLILLFLSFIIYGVGTATNLQARYAGTDLAKPSQRAKAISIAMVATTFGAVAGPNLVAVMGEFAEANGIPMLAGPFILSAAAFTVAGLFLLAFLRPDPLLIAKAIAEARKDSTSHVSPTQQSLAAGRKGIIVGAAVMVLTQVVMIAIMTMTPIHMQHHGHGLGSVGLVIGIHIGAMYLPSLFTGILADKLGRIRMAFAAGFTLLLAGVVAAIAPADSLTLLIVALALLGLGWNFGLISGTALVVDATNIENRAKTQGALDVFIAIAGASGGALSGMVVAGASYAALTIAGSVLSLLLIPLAFWYRHDKNK
ncbi:MFS transporter [Paenibacillus harenae]|uniref:MFS transporter n=1 Tax=Paenibacillus harenae TaxID=306543 RepID=UPI0027D81A07|nr:MFS transporter [Paenibacillus harenae]